MLLFKNTQYFLPYEFDFTNCTYQFITALHSLSGNEHTKSCGFLKTKFSIYSILAVYWLSDCGRRLQWVHSGVLRLPRRDGSHTGRRPSPPFLAKCDRRTARIAVRRFRRLRCLHRHVRWTRPRRQGQGGCLINSFSKFFASKICRSVQGVP